MRFRCRRTRAGREEEVDTAELYAINLDPVWWGKGLGTSLLEAVTDVLRAMGYREAVLWVIPGNGRAIGFYRRQGWDHDAAERRTDVLGARVDEVRYRRRLVPPA